MSESIDDARIGELSVRIDPTGGDVADEVGGDSIDGFDNVLVLLHGYNNDYARAGGYYDDFLAQWESFHGKIPDNPVIRKFFWPGETTWPYAASALSYPVQIPQARRSARRLAEYLQGLAGPGGRPLQVTLVAHSLGCRLVMELLSQLAGGPDADPYLVADEDTAFAVQPGLGNVVIKSIVLMAGAVPAALLEDGERLSDVCREMGAKSSVLYSGWDTVLRFAFPMGQFGAAQIGYERESYFSALGLNGKPESFGDRRERQAGNGHGDYWPSLRVAREVALAMGAVVENELAENQPEENAAPETRELESNIIRANSLRSRR